MRFLSWFSVLCLLNPACCSALACEGRAYGGEYGPNADLKGWDPLPADSWFKDDLSQAPEDPQSDAMLQGQYGLRGPAGLKPEGGAPWAPPGFEAVPLGFAYNVVPPDQAPVKVNFFGVRWSGQGYQGPYPIPASPAYERPVPPGPKNCFPVINGTPMCGDRHLILVDPAHRALYELWKWYGNASAAFGIRFDLNSNRPLPDGATSADAAGLPIFPLTVGYDEAMSGRINHAIRITVGFTAKDFVPPASHPGCCPAKGLIPMGEVFILRDSFDASGYPREVQAILNALKKYGAYVADNGGVGFLGLRPDARWDNRNLNRLRDVKLSSANFFAVDRTFLRARARVSRPDCLP